MAATAIKVDAGREIAVTAACSRIRVDTISMKPHRGLTTAVPVSSIPSANDNTYTGSEWPHPAVIPCQEALCCAPARLPV